ncbi:phosphoribosyl-AMP cyclohydrolase [Blastomonas sp.]|uniref:phosphoribosyl-AMP cyclohydrolase n=1 Tax=Blastomonas sp. TaxID=1909299 RepID=UPI00391BC974
MANLRETGLVLEPKYDAAGLITAAVTDAASGSLLMIAHMNAQALELTLETGEVHFWSRSRARLWKKGESSGNVLKLVELRIDCDQDAVWVIASPAGPTCHTGAPSCFYRKVTADGALERIA